MSRVVVTDGKSSAVNRNVTMIEYAITAQLNEKTLDPTTE